MSQGLVHEITTAISRTTSRDTTSENHAKHRLEGGCSMFRKTVDQNKESQTKGDQPDALQDDDLDAITAGSERRGSTTTGYFSAGND